jgi:hypothetical protein
MAFYHEGMVDRQVTDGVQGLLQECVNTDTFNRKHSIQYNYDAELPTEL